MQLKKAYRQRNHKNQDILNGLCPFVQDPHGDCYCFDIGSQENIRKIIYYCQYNFEACEIYKKFSKGKRHANSTCC